MLPTIGSGPGFANRHTFYDVCRQIGLLTNLQYVIDATSMRCSPAQVAQALTDVVGQGNRFFFGSAETDALLDPVVMDYGRNNRKRRSFYLPTFQYVFGCPLATWSQALHKDNAAYSWAGWRKVNASDPTNGHGFVSTLDGTNLGFQIGLGPTAQLDKLLISQGNGVGGGVNIVGPAVTATFGAWSFYAVSYDEASGAAIFQINGTQTTVTQAYVSPSASNSAATKMSVLDSGDGGAYLRADAMWNRALSAAELTALYNATAPYFVSN